MFTILEALNILLMCEFFIQSPHIILVEMSLIRKLGEVPDFKKFTLICSSYWCFCWEIPWKGLSILAKKNVTKLELRYSPSQLIPLFLGSLRSYMSFLFQIPSLLFISLQVDIWMIWVLIFELIIELLFQSFDF